MSIFQRNKTTATSWGNTVSGVEYFFFSVAYLDNSLGWSSDEFKFRVELLPQSFSKKSPGTYSLTVSCGVQVFFLQRDYPLLASLQILHCFFVTKESNGKYL